MTWKPSINPHVTNLKESATLAINLQAKKARGEGKIISHLGFGQSPFPVHQNIQNALRANAHQKEYLPTKGLPELCHAIAKFQKDQFNQSFSPENILVGPGSKELIFQAIFCLEGDIYVPTPSWVSYGPQLNLKGKELIPIETLVENSYKMLPKDLDEALSRQPRDKQKVLIFNNPSNPTGALYHKEEIEALSHVARKHRLIIISDEIYALINFTNESYYSFHHSYPEGTIVTGGISKSHGAGGYRLGFLALPDNFGPLLNSLCTLISETFSAVSSPIQYAALAVFNNDPQILETITKERDILKIASDYIYQHLISLGARVSKPEGAFYLFPQFFDFKEKLNRAGIHSDKELAQRLFSEKGVATLPGSDFYYGPEAFGLRIANVDFNGEEVFKAYEKNFDINDPNSFVEKYCPNLKLGMEGIESFFSKL